ncbi:hypothetical protein KAJ27_23860, partial [bacterium]|nr:hypothetical protein [bacterium]
MNLSKLNFKSVPLLIVMFAIFAITQLYATGDDYNIWTQAKSGDFMKGKFFETIVEVGNDSVHLEKSGNGNLYFRSGEFLSPKFEAKENFDVIFLSWMDQYHNGDSIKVFVRVGDDENTFTAWSEVKKESELLYDSDYRYIQYKIQMTSDSQMTTPEFKSIAIYYTNLNDDMKNLKHETIEYPLKADQP